MKQQSFNTECYKALKRVPRGKLTTYAGLAKALGSKAARAVGNAMNRNPDAPRTPCHRVVRSSGDIGGYAHGTPKKIAMLRREGIEIRNGKVVDLKKYLFKF